MLLKAAATDEPPTFTADHSSSCRRPTVSHSNGRCGLSMQVVPQSVCLSNGSGIGDGSWRQTSWQRTRRLASHGSWLKAVSLSIGAARVEYCRITLRTSPVNSIRWRYAELPGMQSATASSFVKTNLQELRFDFFYFDICWSYSVSLLFWAQTWYSGKRTYTSIIMGSDRRSERREKLIGLGSDRHSKARDRHVI